MGSLHHGKVSAVVPKSDAVLERHFGGVQVLFGCRDIRSFWLFHSKFQ
jgi:hypothetical protein